MIDLLKTLQGYDIIQLKWIAGLWGIELDLQDAKSVAAKIASEILDVQLLNEVVSALAPEAVRSLEGLLENDGVLAWALFCRRYGEVRVMGPARRDRERPDLNPNNGPEMLWYRGLIGKAFFDLDAEPQEYAYIPEDLVPLLIPLYPETENAFGRLATPKEVAFIRLADERIVDHLCTMLAASRMGMNLDEIPASFFDIPMNFLQDIMKASSLVEANLAIQPDRARLFLEIDRASALALLVKDWMDSTQIDELRMLPGLRFEGNWKNQALETRKRILEMVSLLPQEKWWNLSSFIDAVKERNPDFQRPAGDYDAWFIFNAVSNKRLNGFSAWDAVDGVLLQHVISGPMYWLGLVDLAGPSDGGSWEAFRLSAWAQHLWHGSPPPGLKSEDARIRIQPDARLQVPIYTSRAVRYQLARFCTWEKFYKGEYTYRITPQSLEQAKTQGLRVNHLVAMLRRVAAGEIPPGVLKALNRWDKAGTQVRFRQAVYLEVASPDILDALKKSAQRYLGESLNSTTILIKPGGEEAICNELLRLGYLSNPLKEKPWVGRRE